jgi:hypothetical protein
MLLDTQEPKLFFTKMKDFFKLTVVMWPHIVEKVAVFGLGLLFKKVVHKPHIKLSYTWYVKYGRFNQFQIDL